MRGWNHWLHGAVSPSLLFNLCIYMGMCILDAELTWANWKGSETPIFQCSCGPLLVTSQECTASSAVGPLSLLPGSEASLELSLSPPLPAVGWLRVLEIQSPVPCLRD